MAANRKVALGSLLVLAAVLVSQTRGNDAGQQCGANQTFSACGDPCPERCEDANEGQRKACRASAACVQGGGCECDAGFVRNFDGRCISRADCPRCARPHEFFSCGSACDTTCANVGTACPIINITCNRRCYCVPGYARKATDEDECVPLERCPVQMCGGDANARWARCRDECPRRCGDSAKRTCDHHSTCYPGCNCIDGYVLNANRKCVPMEQC